MPAWLAPAIMAGGSALGGWLSGRAAKPKPQDIPPYTPSPQEAQRLDWLNWLQDQLGQSYQQLTGGIGVPSLEAARDFWLPILQGDRGAISSLLAPDIDLISQQYNAARRSSESAIPRGGGRDVALANQRNLLASEIAGLIGRARPAAAQALFQIGGTAAPIGLQAAGLQGQGIMGALNFLQQGRGQNIQAMYPQLAAQQGAFNIGAQTGRGIWDILNTIWPQGGRRTSGTVGLPSGAGWESGG